MTLVCSLSCHKHYCKAVCKGHAEHICQIIYQSEVPSGKGGGFKAHHATPLFPWACFCCQAACMLLFAYCLRVISVTTSRDPHAHVVPMHRPYLHFSAHPQQLLQQPPVTSSAAREPSGAVRQPSGAAQGRLVVLLVFLSRLGAESSLKANNGCLLVNVQQHVFRPVKSQVQVHHLCQI